MSLPHPQPKGSKMAKPQAPQFRRMEDEPEKGSQRPIRRFLRNRLEGWRLRHQLSFNFWIHMVGIPMALVAAPLSLFYLDWPWALGLFVSGYLLQWIGHLAEGNDLGEWAAIKRLLGWPYVGIASRWNPDDPGRL